MAIILKHNDCALAAKVFESVAPCPPNRHDVLRILRPGRSRGGNQFYSLLKINSPTAPVLKSFLPQPYSPSRSFPLLHPAGDGGILALKNMELPKLTREIEFRLERNGVTLVE